MLSLAVFFSVHPLFLYYIFQPYTAQLAVKNPFFGILNWVVYFVCWMCLQVKAAHRGVHPGGGGVHRRVQRRGPGRGVEPGGEDLPHQMSLPSDDPSPPPVSGGGGHFSRPDRGQ